MLFESDCSAAYQHNCFQMLTSKVVEHHANAETHSRFSLIDTTQLHSLLPTYVPTEVVLSGL